MGIARQIRRRQQREQQKRERMSMPVDYEQEKRMLLMRLGQKDAHVFQLEMIVQELRQENTNIKNVLASLQKLEVPSGSGKDLDEQDGANIVPSAGLPASPQG